MEYYRAFEWVALCADRRSYRDITLYLNEHLSRCPRIRPMSELAVYRPGRAPSLWAHCKNGGRIIYAYFSGDPLEYFSTASTIISPFLAGNKIHRPRAVLLWIGDDVHAIFQPYATSKSGIIQINFDKISECPIVEGENSEGA